MPEMEPLSPPDDTTSTVLDALGALGGLTQTQRLLRVHTPLGPDVLFAEDLEMWEGICPMSGPALGDAEIRGGSAMANSAAALADPVETAVGPVRAGLRLVVNALAADAHLALKRLIGQPALVELLCQDDAFKLRPWHGHIVGAAQLGSDGGLARYQLVIEPWLAALAHRVNAWVYQDMSVPQILDALFASYDGQGHLAPAWRWALKDASVYPRRSLCTQYHESDLDFALRLMREEGLVCWWEHAGEPGSAGLGSHTLVIADHNGAFATNLQPAVRFTASDHTLGEDSLLRWTDLRRTTSSRVAMRSRCHRGLGDRPVEATVATRNGPGARRNELDIIDAPGAYAYEDPAQGQRLVNRQAEALAAERCRSLARGPWRRAQAGTSFTLRDHFEYDGSDAVRDTFVVLAVQHRARNNFSADEKARFLGLAGAIRRDQGGGAKPARDDAAPLHEAALLVQPLAVPVRFGAADPTPQRLLADGRFGTFNRIEGEAVESHPGPFDAHAVASRRQPPVGLNLNPTVHGTQSAIVVGDRQSDLHTDRDGRVRVQLHWQRGGQASHPVPSPCGDNAPASQGSGTWMRAGHSLAGSNFGAVFTPRVGQEVVVAFMGGDIDRPVVLGAAYNGRGTPDAQGNQVAGGAANASGNAAAWFAGQAASGHHEGHQHPAVLLGHKSQELGSSNSGLGGYNQLVFDDSVAGGRIELSTTRQSTRLQLGALLLQQDNRRLAPRGHGLDVATEAHVALRAGSGLLLSAHGHPSSNGSGQQLEARESIGSLKAGQGLVHTLAESAHAHDAKLPTEPAMPVALSEDTARQLPTEQGLHALATSLQGTASSGTACAGGDPTAIDGGFGTVKVFFRPDMVLAAPAGIGLFTPASFVSSAGTHVTWAAGQDLSALAQGHHATAARLGVVFYTYGVVVDARKPNQEVGIKLHAASGNLLTSSNTGATRLTASAALQVTSTKTQVKVASPTQITLAAAGAAIEIGGVNVTIRAPGVVSFKSGQKVFTSGKAASRPDLRLASASLKPIRHCLRYVARDASGQPLANRPYALLMADGTRKSGTTDARGRTEQLITERPEGLQLLIDDTEDGGFLIDTV
jgi:type VI secretion system secreted protein VgrG